MSLQIAQVQTPLPGSVSSGNSTTALLGISATFTGVFVSVNDYAMLTLTVFANVASATDGLVFEWSHNGVDVDSSEAATIGAGAGKAFSFPVRAQYFRVRYINGVLAQATFRLGTVLHATGSGAISKPIDGVVTSENYATLVQAVITGRKPNGDYTNVGVDSFGRLLVSAAGLGADSNGFSYGEITTSATTNVAIRKTTYTEQTANAQRSVASSDANDDGSPVGTGARTIRITYYDSTGAGPFTENIILNGVTFVPTVSATICYIEKIEVLTVGSNGSNLGTISLFVNNTGGGGTIGTVTIGDNRTLWAHHYVPTGKTAFITGMTGNNNNSVNATLFMIKAKNIAIPTSPDTQISDTLVNGANTSQTQRIYGTPIQVIGPARITLFGAPAANPSILSRGSLDFYEQ